MPIVVILNNKALMQNNICQNLLKRRRNRHVNIGCIDICLYFWHTTNKTADFNK